jgi:membrane-bound ClpP family serine protease
MPSAAMVAGISQRSAAVPLAVAMLANPIGAYVALVMAIALLVYGVHAREFVPLLTGSAAGFLTLLAFLHAAPNAVALVLIAAGVALLDAEFRFATSGMAAIVGLAALLGGSWWLLTITHGTAAPSEALSAILALAGSATVLLATLLGWRRSTSS